MFTILCQSTLGVQCLREYRFHPTHRWRFDYAIPQWHIALEVEGGVWTRGRHVSPKGFLADMEKYNRLPIVAEYYKKGYSLRKIKCEVDARFDCNVSINTLRKDIDLLLTEWRENRITDTDKAVSLELARIDYCLSELWEQWEKSKENYTRTESSRKGIPREGNQNGEQVEIQTVERKQGD